MTIICIWPDGDKWIVSRDHVNPGYTTGVNTGAARTETLSVEDTEAEAYAYATEVAAQEGLPLWSQDERGWPSDLTAA